MTFISVDNLLIIHEELCRFNSWSFEFRIPPETSEATLWIDSPGPLGPETKLVILRYHELSHRTVETKNGYRSTYENMFAGYFGVQQGTRVLIYSHMYFCPIGSSMGASNAWESSSQTSLEAGRISKKLRTMKSAVWQVCIDWWNIHLLWTSNSNVLIYTFV